MAKHLAAIVVLDDLTTLALFDEVGTIDSNALPASLTGRHRSQARMAR